MPKARWTRLADADLEDIAYYIAVEDGRPLTARKIVNEMKKKAERYAANPEVGQRHQDLPEGSRYCRHKRWIIVYQLQNNGIDVLRVLDSARDYKRLFP